MQENEKYGIELEAKTSLFKKGLQEAIKYTKAFGQGVKESFSEQITKSAKNWQSAVKQAFTDNGYLKELETLQKRYEETQKMKDYRGKSEDLRYLEKEIARVQELINKEKENNKELEETNKISIKTSSSLHSLFDKSIGKIKRFTYYLLGARSVFSLFMRYRSAYYQFNEEMQYQSELSQNAIALSLGPAFEFLGNVIAYASIGMAKFIELLTGVNVLSKVTTKGIKNYNKSLKETQTLVSGVDEITNLTNPQNLGLADQYKALDEFRKKIQEVEEFFNKNEWIQALANGLKEVWKFIKENVLPIFKEFFDSIGGVKGALILLGGVAVMSALGKLLGIAGVGAKAGTGLAGIAGLLAYIAGLGVITITLRAVNELDTLQEGRRTTKSSKSDFQKSVDLMKEATNKLSTMKKNSNEYKEQLKYISKGWDTINTSIQEGDAEVLNSLDDVEELALQLEKITDNSSYKSTFDISKSMGLDVMEQQAKSGFQALWDGLNGTTQREEERHQAKLRIYEEEIARVDYISGKEDIIEGSLKGADSVLTTIEQKLGRLTSKTYKLKFNAEVIASVGKGATESAKTLADAVAKALKGYASGLDYVPYDNYPALLHKGEAVVPAKYNPTIHSQGNEYTNSLLETLVVKMDDLASRPNVFEIDGQQFANATYGLYDNERKRQGYIEGVVR